MLSFFLVLVAAVSSQDYSVTGKFSIFGNNQVTCIHTILLPGNKILCIERPHVAPYPVNPYTNGLLGTVTDLKTGNVTVLDTVSNPFCSGHAQDKDGNILIIGGDFPNSVDASGKQVSVPGITNRRTFVPCKPEDQACVAGTWKFDTDMTSGRWYPTVTTLADGSTMIMSGSLKNLDFDNLTDTNNPTYEYYPSKPGNWPRKLDALNWAFPFNLYPASFQLTNNKVMLFVANRTVLIDPTTEALDNSVADILLPDKLPWIYPYTPTFVTMPLTLKNNFTSKIMACGGTRTSLDADERCISIDFSSSTPKWTLANPMPVGRVMPDSVILPDGKILFVNGMGWGMAGGVAGDARNAHKPVLDAHLFDPDTQKWSSAGSMTVPRDYHSGAVLLEDGRVLITGSEMANLPDVDANKSNCYPFVNTACTLPFEYRMEIYEPPYLFSKTERPVIDSVAKNSTFTSSVGIYTATDAGTVTQVNLVRFSTSTHSTNMDQRLIELEILQLNHSYILVKMPQNGSIAPPGSYHLFILRDGVPSISKRLLLQAGPVTNDPVPLNPIARASGALKYGFSFVGMMALLLLLN